MSITVTWRDLPSSRTFFEPDFASYFFSLQDNFFNYFAKKSNSNVNFLLLTYVFVQDKETKQRKSHMSCISWTGLRYRWCLCIMLRKKSFFLLFFSVLLCSWHAMNRDDAFETACITKSHYRNTLNPEAQTWKGTWKKSVDLSASLAVKKNINYRTTKTVSTFERRRRVERSLPHKIASSPVLPFLQGKWGYFSRFPCHDIRGSLTVICEV